MPEQTIARGVRPRPTISVILPVFNGALSVERAIGSVLAQTFVHWELLAVDDGSTDDSYERLVRCASADPRVRAFRSTVNRGAAAARNQALLQACGDTVTYLDCFDEYYPDYLSHVHAWPVEADVCLFCYDLIEDSPVLGIEPRSGSWDPAAVADRITEGNIASPLGVAHRRRLLDAHGVFEEKLRSEEDWDLLKRFARAGASFLFQSIKSGLYHIRAGSRERTRRLADLAWQAKSLPAPLSQGGPPRLVRYTDPFAPAPSSAAEQADALVARGTTLAREGKRAEAITLFQQALRLQPDHAKAHHNLGVALAEEKQYPEALASFREALRAQPNYPEAHCNLANILEELGRSEEAADAYRAAIRSKPDYVDALNNLGLALTRLGRPCEAAIFLRQALRLQPDFLEGHNNLGIAHAETGDFAAAEACYEQALRLNPRYPDAHTNLGSTFKEQGRLEEAVACYELALALQPDAVTPRWNRALTWLQMGNFEQGWPEYEWRWKRKGIVQRPFPQPRWDGSPLHGQTILLHVEQGLGDVLQFLRYAPLVNERGGTVVVAAPPPLVRLFATCPGVARVVFENQELPPCDLHAPLMSLPALFGTILTTIPARVPYLAAEPARLERWRERLRAVPGFKVGITWQGNPLHKWDRHRSFPLALMEPLARVNGVSLVSLQKGAGAEQVALLGARFPVLDFGPDLAEFTDSAAIMQCVDLVICCDTSVAHLAGALGIPVWVALATIVDWRWLLEREDSPWYPTMRLFRQERLGEWKPVFQRMAAELGRLRP